MARNPEYSKTSENPWNQKALRGSKSIRNYYELSIEQVELEDWQED